MRTRSKHFQYTRLIIGHKVRHWKKDTHTRKHVRAVEQGRPFRVLLNNFFLEIHEW